MNIYFAGSIRGGRQDRELYLEIITYLKKFGNVLTEHIADPDLSFDEHDITHEEIYQQDMKWLRQSDVVIAEVTQPSLGVGYELGYAEAIKLPVNCLYRPPPGKHLSAMLAGNSRFNIYEYSTIEELMPILDGIFKNL